jgi:hypothetical protein
VATSSSAARAYRRTWAAAVAAAVTAVTAVPLAASYPLLVPAVGGSFKPRPPSPWDALIPPDSPADDDDIDPFAAARRPTARRQESGYWGH